MSLQVAIVGTGAAAFACALRVAEEGARVILVEAGTVGGTCVNVGCVPSKIMIRAAHVAHLASAHGFEGLGRHPLRVDRAVQVAQQQARVDELRRSKYEDVLAGNDRLSVVKGVARFLDPHRIAVRQPDGTEATFQADRVLVATGASPDVPALPGLNDTPRGLWTRTTAQEGPPWP